MISLGIKPLYRAVVASIFLDVPGVGSVQAGISAIVRSASSSLSIYIDNRWSWSTRVPAMSTTLSRSSMWITLFSWAFPWALSCRRLRPLPHSTQIFGQRFSRPRDPTPMVPIGTSNIAASA